jgi:phosphopentomutase
MNTDRKIKRVIWVVLDGVGCGALPDANQYGDDSTAHTLVNISKKFPLRTPNLCALGLGNIAPIVQTESFPTVRGASGRAAEVSHGKDTTSGHWEMAGIPVTRAFQTFPNGFPQEVLNRWIEDNDLSGVLGNTVASGTEIIEQLGSEHIRTKKPIVYTSADSVWQVAAHEEAFGLERLYSICKSARVICDSLDISRVIARPFTGNPALGKPFVRTYNRKDYAVPPPSDTVLDLLVDSGVPVLGIGKISNIFAGHGVPENIDTRGNSHGIEVLEQVIQSDRHGLVFCNLIDFDMLYGHRRDTQGFHLALEEFDAALGRIRKQLKPEDLLMITSDHGNDPTFRGTDHTREYIPILCDSLQFSGHRSLGDRTSFADLGQTVLEALLPSANKAPASLIGKSFYQELPWSQ